MTSSKISALVGGSQTEQSWNKREADTASTHSLERTSQKVGSETKKFRNKVLHKSKKSIL